VASHPDVAVFKPYRFDDHLQDAVVTASSAHSSSRAAEPIIWHHFFSEKDLTWDLLRGSMGYRKGDLVLKGDGGSPVMLAPSKPPIAWAISLRTAHSIPT